MALKKAIVLGASGLVGGELTRQLLEAADYDQVVVLVRKELPIRHERLRQVKVDFANLGRQDGEFAGADVFCCLGTTIRKAGSKEAFRKVDYDYPLSAAMLSHVNGGGKFFLITAIDSNPKSRFFYVRVKGEVENAIRGLGLPEVHVFRPSFLMGHREEVRPGERVGIAAFGLAAPFMVGPLKRYRPVRAENVARAMIRAARLNEPGFHIHENDAILRESTS
jgi:uncharacterized protein YbjT (DUF2867 family)